jgi:excisionase family DNA binding protein
MTERLLTSAEVQQLLRVNRDCLNRWRRLHRIPFIRLGYRSVRFRQEDVARFIQRRTSPARTA